MKAIDVSRIKKMLSGAEGKRLDRISASQSSIPERLRNKDSRQAAAKLLAPALKQSGLTAKQFDGILSKDKAKLEATLKKSKAAAVKNSRSVQKVLNAAAAQRLKAFEAVAAVPPTVGSPEYHLLNTPFMIWPTNSVDLEASEIVPSNSWAKFRVRTENDFYGDVKFYYLWSNPKDTFAVINVDGYVIFNGHAFVGVDGGLFPGDRMAEVIVTGRLDIFEWWNQPPTQPYAQPDQSANALTLKVTAYGFSEVGGLDAKDVFRGYDLRHTLMLVPPFGTIVFAITAAVSCGTGDDSGLTEADFASGAFQVGSPAVLVTVLS
jgi:hypothetical protein